MVGGRNTKTPGVHPSPPRSVPGEGSQPHERPLSQPVPPAVLGSPLRSSWSDSGEHRLFLLPAGPSFTESRGWRGCRRVPQGWLLCAGAKMTQTLRGWHGLPGPSPPPSLIWTEDTSLHPDQLCPFLSGCKQTQPVTEPCPTSQCPQGCWNQAPQTRCLKTTGLPPAPVWRPEV